MLTLLGHAEPVSADHVEDKVQGDDEDVEHPGEGKKGFQEAS